MPEYFLKTRRVGFSVWKESNLQQASELWENRKVIKYISKGGIMTKLEIKNRLNLEINHMQKFGFQYYPIYLIRCNQFIGVCGFRPTHQERILEFGVHLIPKYWHAGLASEASKAILPFGFSHFDTRTVIAGHHPQNLASKALLSKLGFVFFRYQFYEPTGLMHPTYYLNAPLS